MSSNVVRITISIIALALSACGFGARPEPALGATPSAAPSSPPAPVEPAKEPPGATPAVPSPAGGDAGSDKPAAPNVFAAPPGLVWLTNPDRPLEANKGACGSYQVETRLGPSPSVSSVEIFDSTGKSVRKLVPKPPIEAAHAAWCFDVTGDGIPELTLTSRTGGSKWRFRQTLLSMTQPIRELLIHEAGEGTGHVLNPVNLDRQGAFELVDTDDMLARMKPVPGRKTILPVVFAYEKDRYVRATRRFGEYTKQLRADELSKCHDQVCWEDGAAYLLALSLLIGDWDRFKQETKVPDGVLAELETLKKKLDPKLK